MEDTKKNTPTASPDRRDAASWGIAEAKQGFSEMVRAAEEEPQMIFNRDRQVAAVIGGETMARFLEWRDRQGRSVADLFGEVRALASEEGFEMEVPERRDRPDPWSPD